MTAAETSEWKRVRLDDIAEFRNGINYNKDNFGDGIRVISVKDFQERIFPDFDSLEEINPEGVVRAEHVLREGDVLFVRSNGNRELIGRSMFIRHLPNESITHSAFTIRVRFTSFDVEPLFFAYLFRSHLIRAVLSAQGNGANISNLNQDILSRLQVPLPARELQRRIASILSAYDDLIESNTRRITILEEMARRIYEEWFVRFRFPGHKKVRMVESEFGRVPKGFRVGALADLGERVGETISPSATPEEEFSHYSIPAFDAGRRAITERGNTIMSNKILLPKDVVLLSKLNPRIPRIWMTNEQGPLRAICSTEFLPYRERRPFTQSLMYLLLSSSAFQSKYVGRAIGTSTSHQRVKPDDVDTVKVLIAPPNLMAEANDVLAPTLRLANRLRVAVHNLRATRDLLLPKLISGELDVSELPEPESAAA